MLFASVKNETVDREFKLQSSRVIKIAGFFSLVMMYIESSVCHSNKSVFFLQLQIRKV